MDIATLGIAVDARQAVAARGALDRLVPSARRAETATRSLGAASATTAAFIRSLGVTLAGGLLLRGSQALLDASTRTDNALKIAGLSGAALTKVYDRLFDSAQRNFTQIEGLAQLYGRAAIAQKELGASSEELLNFTDKVAVALRVSGKSAGESRGALIQLSQAIGAGIVRAEEFNAILEGALPIAQAAAAGLEEAGGSVAKLRKLIIDGKISSEAFFRAFEAGAGILEDKVANAEITVSQGFVRLQNVLVDTAGKFNDVTGISESLTGVLGDVADAIDHLGDRLVDLSGPLQTVGGWVDWVRQKFTDLREVTGVESFFEGTALLEGKFGFATEETKALEARAAALDTLRQSLTKTQSAVQGAAADGMSDRFGIAFGGINPVSLSDFAAPGGDDKADKAAKRRQDAIDDVIKSLAFEEAQLGRTAREQAMFNALNDAGITINSRYGAQIADSAGRLYDMAEALAKAEERQQMLTDAAKDFVGGFARDLIQGTSAVEALTNAVGRLAERLLDMALDQAISGFFKNLTGGLGGGAGAASGLVSSSVGLFHGGHGPGDAVNSRYVHPAYFDNAPRLHSGIGPGEMPAVIRNDESVLTPGQMRQLAPSGSGGGETTVNIHVDVSGARGNAEIEEMVASGVTRGVRQFAKGKEFNARVVGGIRKANNSNVGFGG